MYVYHVAGQIKEYYYDCCLLIHDLSYHQLQPYQRRWHRAAASGDVTELQNIAKEHGGAGAWPDLACGYTAMHWAAKLGREPMLRVALAAGGDVDARSFGGYTPLHLAALQGDADMCRVLLSLGSYVL